MLLFVLAYLGGVLTIVSPVSCRSFPSCWHGPIVHSCATACRCWLAWRWRLLSSPLLHLLPAGWVVSANQYGRTAALTLLAIFGLTLLFPELADRLMRPLVAVGARLSQSADQASDGSIWAPFLLGIATGFLWAPCAGPVLGLILTGAALQGASVATTLLLLTYAAGAATSLALALVIGGRVFAAMKRSIGAGEWIRRGLGAAVLAAIVAIALGLDTGFLTNVSLASTASLEQGLLDKLRPHDSKMAMTGGPSMMQAKSEGQSEELPVEGTMPSLSGAVEWLNSKPLTAEDLKGKVVLVDFWTYSCINCLRAIPYVRAWAEKYRDHGLVVIGVRAPEFAFERNVDNVKKAIAMLGIKYPVAIDNDYKIWRAFENEYWPAHYFIDAKGAIRHHHFGEGDYDESEGIIQKLLAEAGDSHVPTDIVAVKASGVEAASAGTDIGSPETYVGYNRIDHFASPGGVVQDTSHVYAAGPANLNDWSLVGNWTIGNERALLNDKDGSIIYRFHAHDLHLVLGPDPDGKPVRFVVTIDGKAPGDSHGVDVDSQGQGIVTAQRLYQLVRDHGTVADHTFEIRFLDPGVQAYAFTFG